MLAFCTDTAHGTHVLMEHVPLRFQEKNNPLGISCQVPVQDPTQGTSTGAVFLGKVHLQTLDKFPEILDSFRPFVNFTNFGSSAFKFVWQQNCC
ncbi:hypothetical protein AVEN_22505-1 [Araneus ventricosus]|uniref:Uncharacterized protein n=1 Tax=Araneus ventricosus TaxID=182803 RepID=A0A4Y2RDU7_ARAVE|nr:hypothetical protein AVEN_22505-1 [Araneus ventricosus]